MTVIVTEKEPATKLTVAQARKKIETLEEKVQKLKDGAWCHLCDTHKDKDKFYVSTDPMSKSGVTPICRECARKIALKIGKDKVEHPPDKASVQLALRYLNKPFLEKVWDSSVQEAENLASGKVKSNVWTAYIRQISMVNYVGMTYFDSDFFTQTIAANVQPSDKNTDAKIDKHKGQDTYDDYLKNKKDVSYGRLDG